MSKAPSPPTIEEIKAATLKMEVEHARRLGLPTRVAEAENVRMLERSERIAKDAKPAPKNTGHQRRKVDRGVTTRTVSPHVRQLKPSPCGRCGLCRNCMRERRVLLIMQKRKEDRFFAGLAKTLVEAAMRLGRFQHMVKRDYDRAVAATCEVACNLSIPRLGEWLK